MMLNREPSPSTPITLSEDNSKLDQASIFKQFSNAYEYDSQDEEYSISTTSPSSIRSCYLSDDEPEILHPSLRPKYTNDTIPSSNYSFVSIEDEPSSSKLPIDTNFDELIDQKLKYSAKRPANNLFKLIEDSFDYDPESQMNIHSDYYSDNDDDDLSLNTHLVPPSLDTSYDLSEDDDETESVYDEDIPQGFRNLCIRNCDNSNFEFAESVGAVISDDDDDDIFDFAAAADSMTQCKQMDNIIPSLYDQESYGLYVYIC